MNKTNAMMALFTFDDDMDKECINLCNAINKIDGLITNESCCGHEKGNFRIWFTVKNLKSLPTLLYYCDPCHVGFRWNCVVTTGCAMSPVNFRIESESIGERAHKEADTIAKEIINFLEKEK